MSTVQHTTRRVKPADTCRLTLSIRGTDYVVKPLVVEDDDIRSAWTLRNTSNGQVYTLANGAYGVTCDCADQTFRHEGRDETGCKHIRAFRALGLLG